MTDISIALLQLNPTVGALASNRQHIAAAYQAAVAGGAQLAITGEMALTGYPLEDLVFRSAFVADAVAEAGHLAAMVGEVPLLAGGVSRSRARCYNSAFWMEQGHVLGIHHKHALPTYGVFDEERVFAAGSSPKIRSWRGLRVAVMICRDLWEARTLHAVARQKPQLVLVLNGSPFDLPKHAERLQHAAHAARVTGAPVVYVNLVGGQDELVFDGRSFVMTADGELALQLPAFEEANAHAHFHLKGERLEVRRQVLAAEEAEEALIYQAAVLATRDYVQKSGFSKVVLGLSGGVDSALVAAIAVDALGAGAVMPVLMPSRYTSAESVEDAAASAKLLGLSLESIAIEPAVAVFGQMLEPAFAGAVPDVTEENIQSRIRGVALMALANKRQALLLTTGNKSEMATGYATLYGDMNGAYNPLKDMYKTVVYRVARWRNQQGRVVPENILTKAPTAELRPNQTDQDSLPPYPLLDAVLERLIEGQQSPHEVAASGIAPLATAERIARMLALAEYKRRQAAPGVKITRMGFGRDRRYPVVSGWL